MSIVDLVSLFHLFTSQGISTAVVVVRVEMGFTYDQHTLKTAYSPNPRRPIQFVPLEPKPNQTTAIDVEAWALDDPNDARSETKLIRSN